MTYSRLMLGTVQFGLPYGVANRSGMPSFDEVCAILTCAHAHGVTCLDTAAAYGSSEEVLGRALVASGLAAAMTVVTKVRALGDEPLTAREAAAKVEESVVTSLRWLRLERLPLCLMHREEDYRHFDALLALQARGLVERVGVSVYMPAAMARILDDGVAEAVQLPASLLDQRFQRQGLLRLAQEQGVAVFARSVYLQGLLLMPEPELLPEFAAVAETRRTLEQLAEEAGITLAELAVRYLLSLEGITSVLTGVETQAQMEENAALAARGPLDAALVAHINHLGPDFPDDVLLPYRWPARFRR
jgi:aryl-alcohol dehydrogenase-like predicted oxidoreductase